MLDVMILSRASSPRQQQPGSAGTRAPHGPHTGPTSPTGRGCCQEASDGARQELRVRELTLALFGPRRASAGGTAATPRRTRPSSGAASWPPTRITTTRGLGRAGTACLPVPSTAETTIPSWKRNTLTPTRTRTNPTGTAAPPVDTATTHGTGSECGDLGKNRIHPVIPCHNVARNNN